jgi:hypothetical protein
MRFLPFMLAAAFSTSALAADAVGVPRLHNATMVFTEFWDANKDKAPAEQVAAFKAQVAPAFPGFYKAERFKSFLTPAQYDERIEKAIKEFPTIRASYVTKAQQFGAELPKFIATFKTAFPDFQPPEDIYVLHSLSEMDGGFRTIDGKATMIFGVDSMARIHGNNNESAFFHHELFHAYHHPYVASCDGAGIWSNLWTEGLASYVAHVLNPGASDREMLLDLPDDMATRTRAVLPQALAHVESVLDKDDDETYENLFLLRGKGELPKRSGYYLGYLIAKDAGKTRTVQELAKMECGQVKEVVHATVSNMRAQVQAKSL